MLKDEFIPRTNGYKQHEGTQSGYQKKASSHQSNQIWEQSLIAEARKGAQLAYGGVHSNDKDILYLACTQSLTIFYGYICLMTNQFGSIGHHYA